MLGDAPLFFAFNGPSRAGKTTYAQTLKEMMNEAGITAAFVDEYQYMREWAEIHRDRLDLVRWEGNSFSLFPEAYRYVTNYAARRVAQEAKEWFAQGVRVVVGEGARGVYGGIDDYRHDYFEPILEELKGVEGLQLAHLEVNSSRDEMLRRAQACFDASDGKAPPVDVPARYVDAETGLPYRSSSQALQEMDLSVPLVLSETVTNLGTMSQVRETAASIYEKLYGNLGLERPNGHGNRER